MKTRHTFCIPWELGWYWVLLSSAFSKIRGLCVLTTFVHLEKWQIGPNLNITLCGRQGQFFWGFVWEWSFLNAESRKGQYRSLVTASPPRARSIFLPTPGPWNLEALSAVTSVYSVNSRTHKQQWDHWIISFFLSHGYCSVALKSLKLQSHGHGNACSHTVCCTIFT